LEYETKMGVKVYEPPSQVTAVSPANETVLRVNVKSLVLDRTRIWPLELALKQVSLIVIMLLPDAWASIA
jgi:hypothetical protein